ncbi:hypothetical protein L211DRAFT_438288 [Terfezia boudieri ATCC MYA-4762]|uniref:Tc1-like transposase DDE domain-containing protein n=1 Tax=Terfezia boudieri ATCC MYA-4762 TaxID=1051890 RepID=A0A3N4LF31_9PEZI|nr:hypothetical protein L211DRAFT_438288 [Terfezia boudieri ATCC MYA-4762]
MWPPYSPDLIPIEHVWVELKDCFTKRSQRMLAWPQGFSGKRSIESHCAISGKKFLVSSLTTSLRVFLDGSR